MSIDYLQVSEIVSKGKLPRIPYVCINQWFAPTWLCSTVRVLSIKTWEEVDINLLLSYALIDDSHPGSYLPKDWLPDQECIPIDKEEVKKYIGTAQGDIEEAKKDSDYPRELLLPIGESEAEMIEEAYIFRWKGEDPKYRRRYKKYIAKYELGPTYILFWKYERNFYLLEIHNES